MEFCDEPFALGSDISLPSYTPLGKSVFRITFHLEKPSTDRESPVILVASAALVMRRGEIEPLQFESKRKGGMIYLDKIKIKQQKAKNLLKIFVNYGAEPGGSWHGMGSRDIQ